MNMNIFEQLKEIISDTIPEIDLNSVTADSDLKSDLGINSIDMMMIGLVIEEKFNLVFDESMNFNTVNDICEYIEKKI